MSNETKWKPIESAPMDGTLVLVCRPGKSSTWPAWWRQRTPFMRRHATGWHAASNAPLKFQPTLWMPLPAPPEDV